MKKLLLASCLLASMVGRASVVCAEERAAPDEALLAPPITVPVPGEGRAYVHIKSTMPVQLEGRSSDSAWRVACDSPCDRDLPLGDEYRIAYHVTDGAKRGDTFRLSAAAGGAVTLYVDSGSTVQVIGGVAMALGGAALALVGLVGAAAVASAPTSSSSSESSVKTADCSICGGGLRDFVTFISAVALVAGGGAILTGVLLVNDAGPSTTQKPVFVREPTWAAPRAASVSPGKPAFVVPLSFAF